MLLLTWHGTVVGLQENGGGLVQLVPGEAVPGASLLELDLQGPSGGVVQRIKTPLGMLTVVAAPDGRGLTLARFGQFLCAERGSRTAGFNRTEASFYETFLPLSGQDLADLVSVLRRSWQESATGRTIARQTVQLTSGFRMKMGGFEVDLATWFPLRPARPLGARYEPPQALSVTFGGKALELVAFDGDGEEPIVAAPVAAMAEAAPAGSLVTDPDVQAEISSWALTELATWRLGRLSLVRCEAVWASLCRIHPSLFLFHFRGHTVTLIEKPAGVESTQFHMTRVNAYMRFFTTVAAYLAPDCDFKIAMGVADRLLLDPEAPLFSFQKTRGARTILIPDIDFLASRFHEDDSVRDTLAFSEKAPSAIFVGATTGGAITAEIARACSMPRLRAARFFHGHRRIDFFLPNIVQCDTAETRQILAEMPFCQEQRVSWQEQFTRRYIVSMDGNGATCSRVAVALRSNSVLIKYASAETLFYFKGMKEWLHYVPVAHDRDLEALLDLDEWSPGRSEEIARAGRRFAERFLTREAIISYTATLLSLYAECFAEQAGKGSSIAAEPIAKVETVERLRAPVAVLAHIQNTGDRMSDQTGWAGVPEASHPIEGFQLSRLDRAALSNVTCQGVLADDSLTPPVPAGAYCGTRGKGAPLYGYVLQAKGKPNASRVFVYEARFKDGSHVGPLNAGELCRSPSGVPMTAMRIWLER